MEAPIDTVLDALAAQVRTHPPLPLETVVDLLEQAHREPRGPAEAKLISHHLGVALDGALARRNRGLDVGDLYQEGTVAVVTAVKEYAARSGDPAGLRAYVSRIVALHLDAALEREEEERRSEQALVRDTGLLEAAEVELRHLLGRPATTLELAALLEWSAERVEMLSSMLAEARAINDTTLLPYLDDDGDE
jgi:DNA-directed RNA polymerase sigma subunit (sigma70/sigma32)